MRSSLASGDVVIYDREDSGLFDKYRWRIHHGYVSAEVWKNNKRKRIYFHRLIIEATRNRHVDHINGNPLDNRRSNLRVCTPWQNAQNRADDGITYNKRKRMWVAQVRHGSKNYGLGYWRYPESAMAAAYVARKLLRGPFASRLHFDQFKKRAV